MTAQPSSQAEREDVAREVLAEHAERHGYPLAAASIRRRDDPWFYTVCARAMLAFSDREHATPRSMLEEVDHGR